MSDYTPTTEQVRKLIMMHAHRVHTRDRKPCCSKPSCCCECPAEGCASGDHYFPADMPNAYCIVCGVIETKAGAQ